MKRTHTPRFEDDPDRFLKCQEALDDALNAVAAFRNFGGLASGRGRGRLRVADNHMLTLLANRDLARDLAVLKR
jgi:hypothetical protein